MGWQHLHVQSNPSSALTIEVVAQKEGLYVAGPRIVMPLADDDAEVEYEQAAK